VRSASSSGKDGAVLDTSASRESISARDDSRGRAALVDGDEVGAGDASLVAKVNNKGKVAKVTLVGGIGAGVLIEIANPSSVQRYRTGMNEAAYSKEPPGVVKFPCLPERSPTWQVCGALASQRGISPRL
jgi:hypothetical protein